MSDATDSLLLVINLLLSDEASLERDGVFVLNVPSGIDHLLTLTLTFRPPDGLEITGEVDLFGDALVSVHLQTFTSTAPMTREDASNWQATVDRLRLRHHHDTLVGGFTSKRKNAPN